MKKITYRCPHCTGPARKLAGTDTVVCEGQQHCQFRGAGDDFEITEEEIDHAV